MAAAAGNKFTDTFNSANPNSARVTVTRTAAAASLTCDNLAGWPTVSKVHFSTYTIDTNSRKVAGSQIDWQGIVSGNTIGTMTRLAGATDTGNSIGQIVEMMPTGSWGHDLYSGLTQEHNQDGTHAAITATSLAATGAISGATVAGTTSVSDAGQTLQTYRADVLFDHVASGCVITGTGLGTTLGWSMTSGVVYIGGKRLTVAAATGTVTASKDTYFDLLDPGSGTVATLVNTSGNIVANNAASPALAANSVRIGIVVSGATIAAATSINQGQETMVLPIASSIPYAVTDSLGNLICPRDPNRKLLGYRQIITNFGATSVTAVQVTGLSCPVIIPAGRKIKITTKGGQKIVNSGTADTFLSTWDGVVGVGTQVSETESGFITGGSGGYSATDSALLTPTTTSKTFNAGLRSSSGSATITATTSGVAFIQVELA